MRVECASIASIDARNMVAITTQMSMQVNTMWIAEVTSNVVLEWLVGARCRGMLAGSSHVGAGEAGTSRPRGTRGGRQGNRGSSSESG